MRTRSRGRTKSPARGGRSESQSKSKPSAVKSENESNSKSKRGWQLMFGLHHYEVQPEISSTVLTSFVWCMCLVLFEHILRWVFKRDAVMSVNPILQNERNTQIIARHIGTDFAAAVMCSYLGLTTKNGGLGAIWKSLKSPMDKALYKKVRLDKERRTG